MSFFALVAGNLVADPLRRTGQRGDFATGSVRAHTEGGEYMLVSAIAFGDAAEQLLAHRQGDALALSGRASLRSWTGKDGAEKHGLSLVAEQIASAASARRADAERRRTARAA